MEEQLNLIIELLRDIKELLVKNNIQIISKMVLEDGELKPIKYEDQ